MLNLADIVAGIIMVLLIAWGMRKGFVKSVFSLSSLLLSLVLALTLYPVVSDFLTESVVADYVRLNVYQVFDSKADEAPATEDPDVMLNLPGSLQKTMTNAVTETADALQDTVANSVANLAINLLSILIVFVLVKLILLVLSKLLGAVARLPVIRTANKLLGGIVGGVYGILLVYLILALLTFTTTLNTFNKPTKLVIESKYVSTMYNQNILLNFLK